MNVATSPVKGLPTALTRRLRLPLVAAPMLRVSGVELVVAACRSGVIGAFPTANCRDVSELDAWLELIRQRIGADAAPYCPNLIMQRASLREELACLLRHRVELVITSVGAPDPVIGPLHDIGCLVLADVASLRHAEKAIAAGADGLVLLSAGAGGQTGWANGLAFARAVRAFWDGPLVLAGGVADGHSLLAAQAVGCELASMGTRFIASRESLASAPYKEMLARSSLDDVLLTRSFTGLPANMLRPSIVAAGLDPRELDESLGVERSAAVWGGRSTQPGPKRWADIWSAGHSVSCVGDTPGVAELVDRLAHDYAAARQTLAAASFC